MTPGLCSIIMPCYGAGAFISEALQSLADQQYEVWELIAVEDAGPDDGTLEKLAAFAATQGVGRVVVMKNQSNLGVSGTRNRALAVARGEFVAFLDPDDIWKEDFLQKTCLHLQQNAEVDIVYTAANLIDEQSKHFGLMRGPSAEELLDFPHSLYFRNWINPSQTACRRASLPCPAFDIKLNHIEDWDLWLRMIWGGACFAYLGEPLSMYRRHSLCATYAQPEVVYERSFQFWIKHCDKPDFAMALARQLRDLSIERRKTLEGLSLSAHIASRVRRIIVSCFKQVTGMFFRTA